MMPLNRLSPPNRWLVRTAVVAALWLAAAGRSAAEDATWVKDFLAERGKWERLQGASLTIEGRWSIFNEERLLLTKCDLVFLFDDSVRVPAGKTKNVEVTGRLETRQGMLIFLVTRLKLQPSDAEHVRDERARLETNAPQEWYDLADWATGRGRFYEDEELLNQAADLRRNGAIVEYRQVPASAVEPLFALAESVKQMGLPLSLHDQMIHDAIRRELGAARRGKPEMYDVVLTHTLERLPGSDVPLTLDDATLEQQRLYREDPLTVYEKAKDDERKLLHRMLYAEVALEHIEADAAEDGRNGYQIAARIEQTVPEFAALAEEYRAREVDYQIQHVPELSRESLLTLAARLEQRDQAARAEEVKRRWIAAREPVYRERGVNGKFDLADEYIQLLEDEMAAAELYKEVFNDGVGQEAARTKLVDLGYRFDGTEWTQADDNPGDPTADAIRRGIVRRGMTDDQVQAALDGRPTSIVRVASRGQVTELWVYRNHGVSIRFDRHAASEPRIAVEISDLSTLASE
jgi:hypothetical protein